MPNRKPNETPEKTNLLPGFDPEDIKKANKYPFEDTGLVGDPIPKSGRSPRTLSETGELRLAQITDEVRREAEKNLLENTPSMEDIERLEREKLAGRTPQLLETQPFKPVGNGAADDEGADEDGSRVGAHTSVAQLYEQSVTTHADVAAQQVREREPWLEDMMSNASDLIARAGESAVSIKSTALDEALAQSGGAVSQSDWTDADVREEDTETEKTMPGSSLEKRLERQVGKRDFDQYRGKYAKLNDLAWRRMREQQERALRERVEREEREAKRLTEAEKSAESEKGGIPGYGIVNPDSLIDIDENDVKVHPRELLSASMYDDLINWGTRLGKESPLFQRAFSMGDITRVCDVGCGSGRHAVLFAEWGFKVTGIESSSTMLKRAADYAESESEAIEAAGGEVSLEKGALGGVAKLVGPAGADAITCLGDVLPKVADVETLRLVLDDFADALVPAGVLVLQFTNHARYAQNRVRTTNPVVFDTVEGTKVFLSVMDYPSSSEHIDIDKLTLTCDKRGGWRVRCERAQHLSITQPVIERELLDAGFDIIELSGDFAGRPLIANEDETMIVVARRKLHRPIRRLR